MLLGFVWKQITSNLLTDKLVIRLVLVQSVNDVVAIAPRIRVGQVAGGAGRFPEASDIEPVPAPPLAEGSRLQQAINDQFVGLRRGVVQERPLFFRSWGKPCQVVRDPPQQARPVGIRYGGQVFALKFRENKAVHIAAGPRGVSHFGDSDRLERLPRPVRLPQLVVLGIILQQVRRDFQAGPSSTVLHPLRQDRDLAVLQLELWRHLELLVRVADRLEQNALLDVAGDDSWTATTALQEPVAVIDSQPARCLVVGGVAVVTLAHE